MCVSNHFIEQQAYEMTEKIRKNSLYKFVRVDYSGDNSLFSQKQNDHLNGNSETLGNVTALITKVILEDKDGTLYSVAPNPNGEKFANGEITYKEYRKLQKKETLNGIAIFVVSLSFLSGLMFTLFKYFT